MSGDTWTTNAVVLNLDTVVSGTPKPVTLVVAYATVGFEYTSNAVVLSVDEGMTTIPLVQYFVDDTTGYFYNTTPTTLALGDGTTIDMNGMGVAFTPLQIWAAMGQGSSGNDMVATANYGEAQESLKANEGIMKRFGYMFKGSTD